ncbi:MAG: hypothetical protein ACXWDP_05695 [Solirubrobacterales bacterium]
MPVSAQVVDLESLWQTVVGAIVAATVVGIVGLLGTAIAIAPGMIVVVDK